jgi:hypothetical protein
MMEKKYNLQMRRDKTEKFDERNLDLESLMVINPVIIFPSKHINAWDHLPRFQFLDADMKKLIRAPTTTEVVKVKQKFRSNQVGSPIRFVREGGILDEEEFLRK